MDSSFLKDKQVLLFAPAFFNYENMMAEKMRKMGANVDLYDVRSVAGAFQRALLKVSPGVFKKRSRNYYETIIHSNKDKDYDFILIVKCDMTPISVLEQLKETYPHAKMCLYLYDSVKNIPGIVEKFKYFDTIHSFDINDCKTYQELKFRPLFYGDEYKKEVKKEDDYQYDLSFLGTIHSDRFAVIRQVQDIARKTDMKCYWFLYLQSHFIYWFYKLTKKEFRGISKDTFSFEKKSSVEISKIIDKSRTILDIQHPKQTGLTMRTIEMIGMNKKIITTNATIKKYDFYKEENIAIVDRKKVELPELFMKTPYVPLEQEIYEKYSIEKWVQEVFE